MATILDPNQLSHSFAMLQYLKRLGKYEEEKPYLVGYDVQLEDEEERSNLEFDNVTIPIYDVRPVLENLRVDWNGFEVIQIPSELIKSYFDIRDIYSELKGVRFLLEKHFNTDKVIIYDHTYRKEEDQSTESIYTFQDRPNHSLVIRNPHADLTTRSGRQRLSIHLTLEELSEYPKNNWRIRIVNFWKPIGTHVQSAPLILCDPSSVRDNDISHCDVVSKAYVGESAMLHHSPHHVWFWVPEQSISEATVFVSYDSDSRSGFGGCFHSSCTVQEKEDSVNKPQRESFEVRAIIITKRENVNSI